MKNFRKISFPFIFRMMVNALYKGMTIFLIIALFSVSDAGHLIHELTDHHDTVDCRSSAAGFGTEHTHCDALQSSLPAFVNSVSYVISVFQFFLAQHVLLSEGQIVFLSIVRLSGRAPPHSA